MLEKTDRSGAFTRDASLIVRRIEAIPIALPLKAPMKMAGITLTRAENLLVRVEAANGAVGWGEAPSAPTLTREPLGGVVGGGGGHPGPPRGRKAAARGARAMPLTALGGKNRAA